MNSQENKLIRILNLIKKDSAINSAMDALEQLSLMLLIKFLYDCKFIDFLDGENLLSYENLNYKNHNDLNFNYFKSFLKKGGMELGHPVCGWIVKSLEGADWRAIEDILDKIPFRISSKKILENVLFILQEIDFSSELQPDYEEALALMVRESKALGAYYSPKPLIDAIVAVCKPSSNEKIYDPAMGTGSSFVAVKDYLNVENKKCFFSAHGNDINPFAFLISVVSLLLNRIEICNLRCSDSLLHDDNLKYNLIVSAIPFGLTNDFKKYEYSYHGYSGSLEAMFLKHVMDKLDSNGRAAIVVPDGILFNSTKPLIKLRRELLTQFNLHSILSLPKGTLAPYTNVKVSVLFFNKSVSGKSIWFYDLSTNRHVNKINPLLSEDFTDFICSFDKRCESGRSILVEKKSLFDTESVNLSFSMFNEEASVEFLKEDMITSLRQEQAKTFELFEAYLRSVSQNISVDKYEKVTLKSIGKLRTGDNLTKSELLNDGEFPVYGGNGIIGYFNDVNRHENTIIIGKVGLYCGNIHLSEEPFWLTSNAISLEVNSSSNVFAPYLAHLLKGLDLNKISTGAVQKFVSIQQLNDIEVSLPSFEKQVELSNWFSELERYRDSIQKQLSAINKDLGLATKNAIVEKTLK